MIYSKVTVYYVVSLHTYLEFMIHMSCRYYMDGLNFSMFGEEEEMNNKGACPSSCSWMKEMSMEPFSGSCWGNVHCHDLVIDCKERMCHFIWECKRSFLIKQKTCQPGWKKEQVASVNIQLAGWHVQNMHNGLQAIGVATAINISIWNVKNLPHVCYQLIHKKNQW